MDNNKVNATSTFGNYRWTASASVTPEQAAILADLGFLWVMQRSPSSKAEKVMAGYEKRPDNFKRANIPFDDKGVKTLKDELSSAVEIADGVRIKADTMNVVFHEIGATSEPKYAFEKQAITKHINAGDALDWARDVVGYDGEGKIDTENVALLKAVKAFKDRLLAEQL
jgi:hypothetical protein